MKHDKHVIGVPVVYAPPFRYSDFRRIDVLDDKTLLEIVRSFPDLPPRFEQRGRILINGHEIERDIWHLVRPKKPTPERPISVTLHYPPAGGGGGGTGKSVALLVAALALTLLTAGIASGTVGAALGIAAISTQGLAASLVAGAVGIAGALALSALSAPPTSSGPQLGGPDDTNTDSKEAAGASGNQLQMGGSIPRIVGTRKVHPPFVSYPLVELIDEDEYVEVVGALNGPHLIEDVQIDGVPIADAADVEYETREGWDGDAALTLVTRQGRMIFPQIVMSVHKVKADAQNQLEHPATPSDDLPVWHPLVTRYGPDEIWVHLLMPNGISINGSPSVNIGIPIRVRARRRGTVAWINFPEVHLMDSTLRTMRRALIFKFGTPPDYAGITPPSSASSGFYYAHINVPGQAIAPTTTGWDADAYFVGTGGNDWLNSGNAGGSNVKNTSLFDNRVEFYLDPATFPPDTYEVQIIRGAAYTVTSFTQTTYAYGGTVLDFFTYSNEAIPVIPASRANLADVIQIARVCSVWNEHPIQSPGFALVAIKARNRTVQNISVVASGYVRDYVASPAGWTNWVTTSNPAPHYRDILAGAQNLDPIPDDLIDDAGLVAWRTLCDTEGWTVDAIIDDARTQDALQLLASCGYARPYQSDLYGVAVDNDRSAETPMQVFSPVNSSNFRFEKAFARVPAGIIATYRDNELDDDRAQTVVYQRDGSLADASLLESVSYDGLITEDAVRMRVQFDLDQANLRSTFYYLDTDVEALACRRGDLVAVQHDAITRYAGHARIVSRILGSPSTLITGFVLDSEIPIINEVDMLSVSDMLAVPDMLKVGSQTGIAIRHYGNGVVTTHALSNVTGNTATITLATPITDDGTIKGFADTNDEYGCVVTCGPLGTEYLRMIVAAIVMGRDLKASLVLVDEAPDLVRFTPPSKVLLHFDGADASTTINDVYGHIFTANGNAQIDTAQSKFGGASLLLDGTGDYVSSADHADYEVPGDYTISCFVRPSSTTGDRCIVSKADASFHGPYMIRAESGALKFYASSDGATHDIASAKSIGSISISPSAWYHVAVVRKGDTYRTFLDGVQQDTWESSLMPIDNTEQLMIGRLFNTNDWAGWIEEFSLTRYARWTSNFTPPTAPYDR